MISEEVDASVFIAAFLLFIAIIMIVMVLGAGVHAIISDISNYYQNLQFDRAFCEGLGDNFHFKDETIFGFGKGGSYGCFLSGEDVPQLWDFEEGVP